MILESGGKLTLCHVVGRKEEDLCHRSSDDLVALPASWLGKLQAFAGMWFLRVPVLADEGVGIILLIEIAEGMVDLAMLALVCTNYTVLA
jgi:hypothetical protein